MLNMYKNEKNKRYITIIVTAILIILILWVGLDFGGSSKNTDNTAPDVHVEVLGQEETLDESIRARFTQELVDLKEENAKLRQDINGLSDKSLSLISKFNKENQAALLEAEMRNKAALDAARSDNKNALSDLERANKEALDKLHKDSQLSLENIESANKNSINELTNLSKEQLKQNKTDSDNKLKGMLEELKLQNVKDNKEQELSEEANSFPPPPGINDNTNSSNRMKAGAGNMGGRINGGGYDTYPGGPGTIAESPVVTVMTDLISVGASKLQETPVTEKKTERKKAKDLIIPAGSFVKAQLASGVIAPTGGQGSTDPVPALIRVTGLTQLPNFFKADIKNCFLLAETRGNLATETVNFRLKTLSCKKSDGTTVERDVSGYVTGENGMEGMQGRVVSKQGAIIARAFLAEFASGIGSAFESSTKVQTVTGAGVIESIDPSQTLQAGLAGGLKESFTRLGEFYMDLAEQMVPVIEINAGRDIDVVFIKSVDLDQSEEEYNDLKDKERRINSKDKDIAKTEGN